MPLTLGHFTALCLSFLICQLRFREHVKAKVMGKCKILHKYKPPLSPRRLAEKAQVLRGPEQSQVPWWPAQGKPQEEESKGFSVLDIPCLLTSCCADPLKSDGSWEEEGSGPRSAIWNANRSHSNASPATHSVWQIISLLHSATEIGATVGRRASEVPCVQKVPCQEQRAFPFSFFAFLIYF